MGDKREATYHGADDGARREAERRYEFPETRFGHVAVYNRAAFVAGAAWQAARPVVAQGADDREALVESVSDWLAEWPGATHGRDSSDEGYSHLELARDDQWRSLSEHLAENIARRTPAAPVVVTAEQVQGARALLLAPRPMSGEFYRRTGGYATELDALRDLYDGDFAEPSPPPWASPWSRPRERRRPDAADRGRARGAPRS